MKREVDFLLINPWIYDFSAFDFWLKPYGLLKLAGLLRSAGYEIHYLDLLDPFHPELPKSPKRKTYGTGHFYKEPIPKPEFFLRIPRRFYRYGLPFQLFLKEISQVKFKAIMLTSGMTYWYPGLFFLIDFFSRNHPEIPIYIGGIYPRLCKEHLKDFLARYPDRKYQVVEAQAEVFIEELKKEYPPQRAPSAYRFPAFDLQRKISYVILMTSEGCPFNCPYCASRRLYPDFVQKNPLEVVEEIVFWHTRFGVIDFAFYDDALLVNFERHLGIILENILAKGIRVRFHTPNAMHARFINREVARLLKSAGFTTLRLGLERLENRIDQKVTVEEFLQAIRALKEVGFTGKEVGAYILYGLPEEDFDAVERTILFLAKEGVSPFLAEFSPIPGTPLFEITKNYSPYPLEEDPIFHNKSIFPALKNPPWERIHSLKTLARSVRRSFLL